MRVYVRLFGSLRVVVGSGEVEVALSGDSATVAQALDGLIARYPQARRYLRDAGRRDAAGPACAARRYAAG